MEIGTGIAIAGIWLFPSLCAISRYVNNQGCILSIIIAMTMTIVII